MNKTNVTLSDVLNNPQKPIEEMFVEKQEFIKSQVKSKQDSMKDFAIKRDAAMFAVAESNLKILDSADPVEVQLKQLHEKWLIYFETIYGDKNNE